MKIAAKMYLGFGIVTLLLLLTAAAAVDSTFEAQKAQKAIDNDRTIEAKFAQIELAHMHWSAKVAQLFLRDDVNSLDVQLNPHKCILGSWLYGPDGKAAIAADPRLAVILKELEQPHIKLHESAKAIDEAYSKLDPALVSLLDQVWISHLEWLKQLSTTLIQHQVFQGQTDPAKCGFGLWMAGEEAASFMKDDPKLKELLTGWLAPHRDLHQAAAAVKKAEQAGQWDQANKLFIEQVLPAMNELTKHKDQTTAYARKTVAGRTQAKEIYNNKTMSLLAQVQAPLKKADQLIRARAAKTEAKSEARLKTNQMIIIAVSAGAAVLAILLAWLITRAVVRPVVKTHSMLQDIAQGDGDLTARLEIDSKDEIGALGQEFNTFVEKLQTIMIDVRDRAQRVNNGASEISVGNESLADRLQQEASAIEETNASMEAMAAGIKSSAEASEQADALTGQATRAAADGGQVVKEAVQAMTLVAESSSRINEVVDLVNEIAFQTNLLALNASVEAARAGEAGRGFAVVAGEVRNLAQRSADAAKEIQTLIKESVHRVQEGNELVTKSGQSLDSIITAVEGAAQLIAGLTTTARQQAMSVDEISQAIRQMDDVVQQNAALVEETASASEGLAGEADGLDTLVGRFKLDGGQVNHPAQPRELPPPTAKGQAVRRTQPNKGKDEWEGFEDF